MKSFIKFLIILAIIMVLCALGDTIFNGLFHNDGYRPVTEQMKDLTNGAQ